MRRTSKLLIILLLSHHIAVLAQNPGDTVFNGIQVHTINLQFHQTSYWDSLTTYYTRGDDKYMAASITLDGVLLDSCGVRLKGNSSYSHPNNKKPMKIDFNRYRDSQNWDGLKGLFLNNCFSDPTFMREKIHLDFCRDAGIAAPRANFAMVTINDAVWGLYSIVEPVDKNFLSSHYGNKKGNLYKAVDGFGAGGGWGQPGSTTQVLSDFRWLGPDTADYYDNYELKTDDSAAPWADLMQVISILNNSSVIVPSLTEKIDLMSVCLGIGTDILFANLDSYAESGRNFYLYFNPATEKMEWIVWDTNMSFGGYPGKSTTVESLSLTYANGTASRPLTSKIFGNTELKNQYLSLLHGVYSRHFSSSRLFPHIDSIAALIRPYVVQDTKKQYTLAQFDANITGDITASSINPGGGGGPGGGPGGGGGMGQRMPGLKSFITARQANVMTQFNSLGISGIEDPEGSDEMPERYSLSQNYPNPFNPTTTIQYRVPESGIVSLKVYDLLGNEIAELVNGTKPAGTYSVIFDGTSVAGRASLTGAVPSGVYIYKLTASEFQAVRKMAFIK